MTSDQSADGAEPTDTPAFAAKPPAVEGDDSWNDLAGLDEDYNKAEARERGNVPDGKYQVRVDRVSMARTKNTDTPMLKFDLVIISGKQKNRHIFKNSMLTTNSLSFLKSDLAAMGIALPKFSDLPKHLDEMIDQKLEVTTKTTKSKDDPDKEYNNVYFDRKITVPVGDDGPDETQATAF
jgi:hypothetical protein